MALTSLNLPQDPQLLAPWLEEQICSENLAQTAVEWEVIAHARPDSPPLTLAQLAGPYLAEIEQNGLKSLPEEELRQLMAHPEAVLELQEHLLTRCPPYWQQRLESQRDATRIDAAWTGIESQLTADARPAGNVSLDTNRGRNVRTWSVVGALMTLAASLLIAVALLQPPQQPTGWGFTEPGILESAKSEGELLDTLADATHTWFNKRPDNREDLALRLKQFDAGCQKLLDAELAPLSPEAHQTVDQACEKTRREIADYLDQLDKGADPATVRDAADQTVTNLEETLRQLKQPL